MAIFKRGKVYWYHFLFNGEHVQESTHQGNPRTARQIEAAHRTRLAKCEVGIEERKPAPALAEFSQRFIDEIQVRCAGKPATVEFYACKLKRLLEFEPLASARLDRIDEELIAAYVQNRSKQASRAGANRKKPRAVSDEKTISAVSVNRELATLRRLLRLAHDWQIIPRVPKIRLNLKAERNREYVMDQATERNYLEFAAQPIRDAALLLLDCGLRIGELLALEWSQVHFQPVGNARFGYIHIRKGKSKNAPRNLSLSPRVKMMLESRHAARKSPYVFTDESGLQPVSINTLEDQHKRMKTTLKLHADAVIHSFRHTFGTPTWGDWRRRIYDHASNGTQQCSHKPEVCAPDTRSNGAGFRATQCGERKGIRCPAQSCGNEASPKRETTATRYSFRYTRRAWV